MMKWAVVEKPTGGFRARFKVRKRSLLSIFFKIGTINKNKDTNGIVFLNALISSIVKKLFLKGNVLLLKYI